MVIASGNQVVTAYVLETTRGTTPASPTLTTLRATQRNVNPERALLESDEVRASGQISDARHGFQRVVGTLGGQLSTDDFNDILRIAFRDGAWGQASTVNGDGGNLVWKNATSQLQRTDGGNWATAGWIPGMILGTTTFSNNGNNGDWIVTAVEDVIDGHLTVIPLPPSTNVIVDETSTTANGTAGQSGQILQAGTNLKTMTLERQFPDIAQYQAFRGVAINRLECRVQPDRMVTLSMDLIGMSGGDLSGTSVSGSPADPPPFDGEPFDAFTGSIYEGGTLIGVVTGINWSVDNQRSLEGVVGSRTSPDVFDGTARWQGEATVFFENATMFNKFINETASSIWLNLRDLEGNWIQVIFPNVKYTGAPMDPPQSGPVRLTMPFLALEDASGHSAYLQRSTS